MQTRTPPLFLLPTLFHFPLTPTSHAWALQGEALLSGPHGSAPLSPRPPGRQAGCCTAGSVYPRDFVRPPRVATAYVTSVARSHVLANLCYVHVQCCVPFFSCDRYRRPSPLQHARMPSLKRALSAASGWSVGEAPSAHAPLRCSRGRAWRTRGMRASSLPARAWHAFLRCLARAGLALALHTLRCTAGACYTRCSAQLTRAGASVRGTRALPALRST